MKNKLVKFTLIIPALAGLFLLASVPHFSTKANGKDLRYETEDEVKIDKTIHDFGTISSSEDDATATFTITNNSKVPLKIINASASCGCTTPEWTKEPIEPGKTGKVTATYKSKNTHGPFTKTVTITTDGNPSSIAVKIKGTVE